jgi:hypothetical protein
MRAGDRLADAGKLLQAASPAMDVGERRGVLDRLGGALVGHELEERLAREFHQRADLFEPLRDLRVGSVREGRDLVAPFSVALEVPASARGLVLPERRERPRSRRGWRPGS